MVSCPTEDGEGLDIIDKWDRLTIQKVLLEPVSTTRLCPGQLPIPSCAVKGKLTAQMVDLYVKETGNVTILERAIPLMEVSRTSLYSSKPLTYQTELAWWRDNRTIEVTSPFTNKTHQVAHYAVINSAPRPEVRSAHTPLDIELTQQGYVEDYNTVEDASPPLNASAKADLYAELATGAESGIDYSIRWCKFKSENVTDNEAVLRGMNARAQIPPDLNALLAGDHALVSRLLATNNHGRL